MSNKIITLTRGDDGSFLNQVLLIISFKTKLDLQGYKIRLTIENPTNFIKMFEVINNAVEIDLDKTISSTLEVGKHKCNIKLLDTLNRVKTVKNFEINIEDEFDSTYTYPNEYELEIVLDEGINKYKNYEQLYNKPSINEVVLEGNKTFNELGITQHINNVCDSNIEKHDTDQKAHKYIQDQIMNKQDRLIAGSNITIIDGIISSLGAQGGVTTNYKHLGNKPSINNVILDNNLSLDELGIQAKGEYITEEILNQKGFLTSVPSGYITEEELYAENYLKEIPSEYYTDTQNQEIYATIGEMELKQDKLTAGNNIEITENLEDGIVTISAIIPEEYITESELSNKGYVTEELLSARLSRKQNPVLAGDNIRFQNNTDGSITISAIDTKNPSEIVSYNALSNKPSINGIGLIGNKNLDELGIQPAGNYQISLTAGENISIEDNIISANIPDIFVTDIELQEGLDKKADKGSTLASYNIEDAYTKDSTNNLIINNIKSKITDSIIEAPNGVVSYTETTLTVKNGLKVLFSNGLNKDNTYNNIEAILDKDLTISLDGVDWNELYSDFYVILTYDNNTLGFNIIPKSELKFIVSENIPKSELGYIKNVNENKYYRIEISDNGDYIPVQKYIKVIAEGTMAKLEQEFIKVSSITPYSVYRILNKDELLLQIKDLQPKLTFGENFINSNNIIEYRIPYNYVTKEFLIENSFTTQTDVNDAVNIHNANNLSHQDIRQLITNLDNKVYSNYVTNSKLVSELQPYALITDIPDARDFCTKEQYNALLNKVNELETLVNKLINT